MKSLVVLSTVMAVVVGSSHRLRREAFQFADAIDEVVGQVRTTFQCPQRYGYFADVDNDCKVYHVCNPVMNAEGGIEEVQHFSFFCGNQTVFNQLTLTCAHPEEAVPCPNAPDFFYVNDNIGKEDAPFLTDDDTQRAAPLYPGYSQPAPNPAQAPAATSLYYHTVSQAGSEHGHPTYSSSSPSAGYLTSQGEQKYVSASPQSQDNQSHHVSTAFGQRARKK
ncbi:uncharacterized protein LOC111265182 [Varroa jacobsoni]|nr:uncharacterized protein LOC111247923 isoform X2 [Varroa destructor]XP_022655204.1 uncharacterized protein LOC111247923 isoform X2 [Varroa destructor]XP_022655205.1 uncharacterized protein LOC111247923 isoform X2 [Varroa destructor]XP_022697353.1 uncharacterized protein LOC111265182 [Varroa jacobsoni]XP_022697364.1 uncharacterized protein LOC111265182 [Varroa jacobsoni]XP_022697372.1 uncharacterized protein LOC111265182 [Varroa jacobsoni]XP_022697382.1 uncharacterized protein LOC111265182 [